MQIELTGSKLVLSAAKIQSLWGAVLVVSLAAAARQGWSSNLLTLPSDLFPKSAVASVVGIGTFAGAIGGMLIATATGWLLQKNSQLHEHLRRGGFRLPVCFARHSALKPTAEPGFAGLEGASAYVARY